MKIFQILLFLILFANEAKAQSYKLMPDTCTLCFYFWGQSGSNLSSDAYKIDPIQDTLIDGNNYVKIIGAKDYHGQPAFIRQIGNKLYGRQNDSIVDRLIMDFDVSVGDTIVDLFSEGHFYDAVVELKDSFILNDGSYNTFMDLKVTNVSGFGWSGWNIVWSEGGLCGGFQYPNPRLGGVLYNMEESVYQGLEVAYYSPSHCTVDPNYTMTNGSTCSYCTGISGYASIIENEASSYNVYPNPAYDQIAIKFKTNLERDIIIVSSTGQELESYKVSSSIFSLNISHLESGYYLLSILEKDKITKTRLIIK